MLASAAISLMAAFTGLSLTQGASMVPVGQRKLRVVMAAIALGGGIWSMHFVAMLGLQMPVLFYYNALITLISALLAVLLVGLALLILHFFRRTRLSIIVSGGIVGIGIVLMHFTGMLAMEGCRPVNSILDYGVSTVASVALSVLAIGTAYGARTSRNMLTGTICLGLSVALVHYLAVFQTGFTADEQARVVGPYLDNQSLALGVTVIAFLICSAFLLTGVTFLSETAVPAPAAARYEADPAAAEPLASDAAPAESRPHKAGVPFERDGRTQFAALDQVAAIRAEGHYTLLYIDREKLFCPWSISEAEGRLKPHGFVRTHRGYLINPRHVSGFERLKDTGLLYFEGVDSLLKIPVSRSRMRPVRETLGL